MKRLLAIAALVVVLSACDSYPYQTGRVLDKDYNEGTYYLKLSTVVTHNEAVGWQPVSPAVYGNCQVGETWDEERSSGCPEGGGGGGSW